MGSKRYKGPTRQGAQAEGIMYGKAVMYGKQKRTELMERKGEPSSWSTRDRENSLSMEM